MAENATVARPYAQAAFETAHGAGELARWGNVLDALGIAIADERVATLLGNPHVRTAALVELLADIGGIGEQPKLHNFLQLLADNGRLALLPEIGAQFAALRADVENTVEVTVTSALPPPKAQSSRPSSSTKGMRTGN